MIGQYLAKKNFKKSQIYTISVSGAEPDNVLGMSPWHGDRCTECEESLGGLGPFTLQNFVKVVESLQHFSGGLSLAHLFFLLNM